MDVNKLDLEFKLQFREIIRLAIESDDKQNPPPGMLREDQSQELIHRAYLAQLNEFLNMWEALSKKKHRYYRAQRELEQEYAAMFY